MAMPSTVRPIFRAVVSTVVPEANQLDEDGWRELEALVETALRDRPPTMLRQLQLFLHAVQWLSVLRYGRGFVSLSAARRAQFLSHFQDHPFELIRCGFWGLRTLALLGFYGRAGAVRTIGYAADPGGWRAAR